MNNSCNIIDNNLLSLITKKGNFQLFQNFQDFMATDRVASRFVKNWQISPSLIPEFLGITVPLITIDDNKVREDLRKIAKEKPVDIDKIVELIDWMIPEFEAKLKDTQVFSKSVFLQKFQNQLLYTDENLREPLTRAFAEALTDRGINLVINRTAIELTVGYSWPKELQPFILATFGRNLHFSFRDKLNFNIVRICKLFAQALIDKVNSDLRTGLKLGSLSPEVISSNTQRIMDAVCFKNRSDFLDTEAVFGLCAGLFYDNESHRVLVTTMDPIDDFLIRIGVFKSLFSYIIDNSIKDESVDWQLEMNPGWAIVFNKDMIPEYKIEVSKILPLVDEIFEQRIEDWLAFHKFGFKTRRVN
jgi:hypothetical protein